jgi:hypothetical protein
MRLPVFMVFTLLALDVTLGGCDKCGDFPWSSPGKACRSEPPAR